MIRLLIACLLVMIPMTPVAAQEQSAAEVVEQFQATLIAVMKDAEQLGYAGRYQRLAPAIEASHDLPGIAKFAAGRYWDKLTAEQQKLLVDTFTRQSIATYAYRFDGYSSQSFKTASRNKTARGDRLVHTLFNDPGSNTLRFDYVLRETNAGWRIVNIIVDGVSDLAIKRSEYSSILRGKGIDALIEKLNGQIAQYAKPASQ